MIVKILSKTATFNAVRYNTNKMDRQTGELMRIKNFGILGNVLELTPEEVKNYLKAFSAANKRVKSPQFHAIISCKGREYNKEQLANLAESWLSKMGYGENPYIVVFHSDTENNHVHIVSTRVTKDGKKVDDRFDRPRAIRYLDEILKQDIHQKQANSIKNIESYSFSTLAQFKMLFEKMNFSIQEKDGNLTVWKSGEMIKTYSLDKLNTMAGSYRKDNKRLAQLRQIVHKYKTETDSSLVGVFQKLPGNQDGKLSAYQSDLTDLLHEKFGLEFIFHFKRNHIPYGYTMIDHKNRTVIKGSELMKLSELVDLKAEPRKTSKDIEIANLIRHYNIETPEHASLLARLYKISARKIQKGSKQLNVQTRDDYRKIFDYFLKHRPLTDLARLNIFPIKESGKWYLLDTGSQYILPADDVLPPRHIRELNDYKIDEPVYHHLEDNKRNHLNIFTNDVDDERVYGKERRKKKRENL
ncbi:relaxase/mobilization nuclease domain-containing protein [Gaoshiqia sp. Z1-71]|uniref:relaxase/mobilization nuclease domain-containing protein n=1 Tax=Gaoshiqia hydrogeniformans TaxID=3290090 RepID=UPI003BF8AC77